MPEPTDADNTEATAAGDRPRGRIAALRTNPWATFLLPFVVFMLIAALEPKPEAPGGGMLGLAIAYEYYPLVYMLKIGLTIAAVLFVWPGYRQFPFRVGPLGVATGVVGIVVWIGLCSLQVEQTYLKPALESMGMGQLIDAGARSAFNPLEHFAGDRVRAYGFLAVRLVGLVLVIAVIEEFFLRGFVLRFMIRHDWWNVPIGRITPLAAVAITLLAMATHPAELLAAAVWFSMVTWLYVKTRNIWDCIAAHAITNLLLGIYVIRTGEWHLM